MRSDSLWIMEDFYSLQGEGFHTGQAAYFIRLAGCRVGCRFCDVKEAWTREDNFEERVENLVKRVLQSKAPRVVITGGEPMLQNLDVLCEALKREGISVWLETSGTEPYSGDIDWVCLSPKKNRLPLADYYQRADELKIVIEKEEDFLWAEEQAALTGKDCLLFLQPEWESREEITPLIIAYIQTHPQWRLSLQTHKYTRIR